MHGKGHSRAILAIFTIGVLVFAAIQYFLPHLFPGMFTSVAAPFWRAEFAVDSGSLRDPSSLLMENESLKRSLIEDGVRLQTIQAIEQENRDLKSLLGRDVDINGSMTFASTSMASSTANTPSKLLPAKKPVKKQTTSTRILAAVLMRPPFVPYDELIIDAGNDLGISAGDHIYAPGDVLIGTVSDVLPSTSKVSLFSSAGQSHEVLIGQSNVPAQAIGRGGGQYGAVLPISVKVSAGDIVISPSLSDRPFGIVTSVVSDTASAFETVLFAPPVDLYQLRWVLIEKNSHE